jgi:hypothetical protein
MNQAIEAPKEVLCPNWHSVNQKSEGPGEKGPRKKESFLIMQKNIQRVKVLVNFEKFSKAESKNDLFIDNLTRNYCISPMKGLSS